LGALAGQGVGQIIWRSGGREHIFLLKMLLIQHYTYVEQNVFMQFSTKIILTVGKFDSWYQSDVWSEI